MMNVYYLTNNLCNLWITMIVTLKITKMCLGHIKYNVITQSPNNDHKNHNNLHRSIKNNEQARFSQEPSMQNRVYYGL